MLVANLTHAYILEARHYCLLRTLEKLDTPTILWMSLVLTKRIGTNYQKKLVLYGYLLSVDDLSSKATRGKESEIFLLSHMHVSYKNKYPFFIKETSFNLQFESSSSNYSSSCIKFLSSYKCTSYSLSHGIRMKKMNRSGSDYLYH